MSMQVAIFSIRGGDQRAVDEMNSFLRGHRVLTFDRQVIEGAWSFCVTWQMVGTDSGVNGASKIDYKQTLDAATFALFSKLRDVRKSLAEKESLPAYAVFTNEQLAAIAKARCVTPVELGKIDGIGSARVEKYGAAILAAVSVPAHAP